MSGALHAALGRALSFVSERSAPSLLEALLSRMAWELQALVSAQCIDVAILIRPREGAAIAGRSREEPALPTPTIIGIVVEAGTEGAQGVEAQAFVDKTAAEFRALYDRLGVSYDDFIRTTEPRHKKVVRDILQKLFDAFNKANPGLCAYNAAIAGGAGEQAIHGGSEPCHREPFAEAGRTAFRPVYPDAAAARVGAFRICGEPYGFTILQQAGTHAEASIAAIADHVAQGSAAQDARRTDGAIGLYSAQRDDAMRRHYDLLQDFGAALEADDQLRLVYQPRVALDTAAARQAFESTGTVKLKGDWTNRDPEITALLKELGRAGVPLYLYWAPGAEKPKILPQILTEASIVSELTSH